MRYRVSIRERDQEKYTQLVEGFHRHGWEIIVREN